MNYCRRSSNGILVNKDGRNIEYKTGLKKYLNALCHRRMSSFEGTIEATKQIFGYRRMVPIYIDKKTLLFSVSAFRNYESVWINFFQVLDLVEGGEYLDIIFLDGTRLCLRLEKNYFPTQWKRCEKIAWYLSEKSIESVYNYGLSIEI